ncbi:MAG: transketolase C-terminal domain-containing protein, partial [Coriobacteriia bacterium]|nr:transketolase C-terminal domain-containing protein [Coriobacteriia bacterium]
LDVGEDGKTHQCLDYAGAWAGFFGWKVIVPADPNQTDRAVRAAAGMQGNVCIAMGRSRLDPIMGASGTPLFGDGYEFEYGRIKWARHGSDACILVMGTPAGEAVRAADALAGDGLAVAVGIVACPAALDDAVMAEAFQSPLLVTVEDHHVDIGLGAAVARWGASHGVMTRIEFIGVDSYQSSGTAADLFSLCSLDAAGITHRIRESLV